MAPRSAFSRKWQEQCAVALQGLKCRGKCRPPRIATSLCRYRSLSGHTDATHLRRRLHASKRCTTSGIVWCDTCNHPHTLFVRKVDDTGRGSLWRMASSEYAGLCRTSIAC